MLQPCGRFPDFRRGDSRIARDVTGFALCSLDGAALQKFAPTCSPLFELPSNRPLEKLPLWAIFARWIAVAPEFFLDFRLIQARLFSYFYAFRVLARPVRVLALRGRRLLKQQSL